MAGPEQQPQNVSKIIGFEKLSMWTPTPGVEGKRARLSFGILGTAPRLTVFTNNPEDTVRKGVISAGMNAETFYVFLDSFERIIKGPADTKLKVDCYTSRWENDKPTNERILNSEVFIGKDAEGFVWLSVISQGRPTIRFTFKMSDWHTLYKTDGTKFSEVECSVFEAAAKLKLLRDIYPLAIFEGLKNAPVREIPGAKSKSDLSDGIFEDLQF